MRSGVIAVTTLVEPPNRLRGDVCSHPTDSPALVRLLVSKVGFSRFAACMVCRVVPSR